MKSAVATAILMLSAVVVVDGPGDRGEVSLVITNGIVVTVESATGSSIPAPSPSTARDIVAVDTSERRYGASFGDARRSMPAGQVVMPGLVNTHTHAPMVLYRGLADDLALKEWLTKYIFPAEAKTVSPEFVRAGTRLAALEMIESGTTTYADMYYFEEEIAKETKAAGLRGVLGQTVIQFPVADAKTPAEGLARAETFIRRSGTTR